VADGRETLKDRLVALLEPAIEAEGMELVQLEIGGAGRRQAVRVFLDKPGGVGLDDCARMSRTLGALIDVEDPISASYVLEVSSPGVNRPLTKPAHFERAVGQRVRVKMKTPLSDGARNLLGVLTRCTDAPPAIVLDIDGREVTVALDAVRKAHIDYPFDALAEPRR